ncbi:MAG: type II CAAX endopeptidase family protein [Cellulophaga sp.]|uniref:CPBP family intramembrane glutamic endopeptidase n=1 Tax=unclassified Cellulophaga TaxID=2634405 RepID=UPI0026E38A90|nr:MULTISPECIES: type II CAAX endopeptidase family protein [unclassified Cellulophaga]MDO6490652.1 type II CAAX endopeptidase family protein [Cellulophaga sp. 2_MG-2023]MDO6494154.1 type II CAAX endopeptidase family protein [Cellulophaga sp. 3_MG-2023]
MKIPKAILITLLFLVISYIPSLGLIGLYKFTELFGEGVNDHFYSVVIFGSLISYFIIFYLFWKPRPKLKKVFNINKLNFAIFPYLLIIVIGLGFTWQPIFDLDKIIDYYSTSEINIHSNKFYGFTPFFLYFNLSAIIIAPIFEELFFRKLLFIKLLEYNKVWPSILISSLCFSAIHFETPSNLIPTFVYGIIACLIYIKTKNIIYLIVIHFFNNFCSILYSVYGEPFYDWLYNLNYGFTYWALVLFGILITIMSVRKIRQLIKPKCNEDIRT